MIVNSINKAKEKKIPKQTCTVKFGNKAIELMRLPQIFNLPEVVFRLADKLKNNDNNLTVTYQLGRTITMKILNYKKVLNSIYVDEDVCFCFNTVRCDCVDSSFCGLYHKHTLTGDLLIIKNNKLRKPLKRVQTIENPEQ